MPEQLSGLLIHATDTPTWLLRPVKASISSELHPDFFFFVACFSWFFRDPVFLFTPFPMQSVRLPLATYPSLCNACVTYRTPCHASSHQVLPTQPFPIGDKYFKHVLLLIYLIYFSPKEVYMVGSINMCKSPCGTLISLWFWTSVSKVSYGDNLLS